MLKFKYKGPGLSISHFWDDAHIAKDHPLHTHTFLEIYIFLGGRASFHIEGNVYPLKPGDILLFRPNEGHRVEVDPEPSYERIVINFDVNLFSSIDPEKLLLRPYFDRSIATQNLYHKDIFPEEQYRAILNGMLEGSGGNRYIILSNLILFLSQINEAFANCPPETEPINLEQRILQYIDKNLHCSLDIPSICERFHISKATLFRICKNTTGMSVSKYIRTKRLLLCHMLIEEGEKPSSLYSTYGFQDYSSFYRAYVKQFGHSPREKNVSAFKKLHPNEDD